MVVKEEEKEEIVILQLGKRRHFPPIQLRTEGPGGHLTTNFMLPHPSRCCVLFAQGEALRCEASEEPCGRITPPRKLLSHNHYKCFHSRSLL